MKNIITAIIILAASIQTTSAQNHFQKITSGPLANDLSSSSMCSWVDYDNDNHLDILVVPWNTNCAPCEFQIGLYKNTGENSFARVNTNLGELFLYGNGLSWGDYDNDGRQDLYITRGLNRTNLLFHNDGNGQFTRIVNGEIVTDQKSSVACAWGDFNRDGWLDMFVANAFSQNDDLYRNNGDGTFTKITEGPLVTDGAASQSCAWGDYDKDGWTDLFVTTYLGQKDLLYHNNGDGTFTKINSGPVVNDQQWGSGCAWVDYDNDTRIDLFVSNTNGYMRLFHNDGNGNFSLAGTILNNISAYNYYPSWGDYDNDRWVDLFVPSWYGHNKLYKNSGGLNFQAITNEVVTSEGARSDAAIWGDYNNDGKLDLFVSNSGYSNKNFLYKNTSTTGRYLTINLNTSQFYDNIIGTKIKVVKGNIRMFREVSSGNGSQNMTWQHFGLGDISVLDSVIIYWPSGSIWHWENVDADIVLNMNTVGIGPGNNSIPFTIELSQNYPNPFNPSTHLEFGISDLEFVSLKVYNALGKEVMTLVNEIKPAGRYEVTFDGSNLSSGVYFYKIQAGDFSAVKRMTLIK